MDNTNHTQNAQPKGDAGLKYDDGKLRMDLIPPSALKSLAAVLTFGAKKYDDNTWQGVEMNRYEAALLRHFTAYMEDPLSVDEESGLLHIEHVICNAVFLNHFCQINKKDAAVKKEVDAYLLHLDTPKANPSCPDYAGFKVDPTVHLTVDHFKRNLDVLCKVHLIRSWYATSELGHEMDSNYPVAILNFILPNGSPYQYKIMVSTIPGTDKTVSGKTYNAVVDALVKEVQNGHEQS